MPMDATGSSTGKTVGSLRLSWGLLRSPETKRAGTTVASATRLVLTVSPHDFALQPSLLSRSPQPGFACSCSASSTPLCYCSLCTASLALQGYFYLWIAYIYIFFFHEWSLVSLTPPSCLCHSLICPFLKIGLVILLFLLSRESFLYTLGIRLLTGIRFTVSPVL